MNAHGMTRRKLLAITGALAVNALPVFALNPADLGGAEAFLKNWDTAWNRHDAQALGALHTEDAITVNRFGTMVSCRSAVTQPLPSCMPRAVPLGRSSFRLNGSSPSGESLPVFSPSRALGGALSCLSTAISMRMHGTT